MRRLAVDLGVHFNTVADAYRTLGDEGWLEIEQGRGVRVREREAPSPGVQARQAFRQRLRQLVAEARAQGLSAGVVVRELAEAAEAVKG